MLYRRALKLCDKERNCDVSKMLLPGKTKNIGVISGIVGKKNI